MCQCLSVNGHQLTGSHFTETPETVCSCELFHISSESNLGCRFQQISEINCQNSKSSWVFTLNGKLGFRPRPWPNSTQTIDYRCVIITNGLGCGERHLQQTYSQCEAAGFIFWTFRFNYQKYPMLPQQSTWSTRAHMFELLQQITSCGLCEHGWRQQMIILFHKDVWTVTKVSSSNLRCVT